jgi:hypothetical protein
MLVVDHLIARSGVPPLGLSGNAYDYIVAGDGLIVQASNRWLVVRLPVAAREVRGLQPVRAACALAHGKIPSALWHIMIRLLWQAHRGGGSELLMSVRYAEGAAKPLFNGRRSVASSRAGPRLGRKSRVRTNLRRSRVLPVARARAERRYDAYQDGLFGFEMRETNR